MTLHDATVLVLTEHGGSQRLPSWLPRSTGEACITGATGVLFPPHRLAPAPVTTLSSLAEAAVALFSRPPPPQYLSLRMNLAMRLQRSLSIPPNWGSVDVN